MSDFLKLMTDWDGYHSVRTARVNEAALVRAIELVTNKPRYPRHEHVYRIQEALTTSDFPFLLSYVLDRQVLARYQANMADWPAYCKITTVPDFNQVHRYKVYGNDNLLPLVVEKGEYLVSPHNEARYYYHIDKYGRQLDISWESLVNDSLGALADIPERFATAAVRSEARFVTGLYAAAAGPNPALFGAPITDVDLQNVTNLGILPLTILNLETTLQLMSAQTDPSGEPISVRGVHLVVPPALEFTARQILTSAIKQWAEGAAGTPVPYPTSNVVSQIGLQLHVDPYLPIVDVSANRNITWYLFAEPSQGAAMEFARLRGEEAPEICMKNSDKVSTSGVALSSLSGDFATDNVFYRIRHCFGGRQLDPRFAYSQQGAGRGQ